MIKKLAFLVVTIVFAAASQSLLSQTRATLTGVVKDRLSGEALIGATVSVMELNLGDASDLHGHYRINSLPPGDYTMEIRYIGYHSVRVPVSLQPGEELKQDVLLDVESIVGEEAVITVQAKGQIASINQQLADNTIKNIVSAKKIQETPNANAAEAIGRIAGVSIVRSGGEGSKVVIRGLAPKFNKVQVEGISMASTGGDDRSTDLSMISPYMLDGIELSKAAMADQEGDVIGGSVNFILRQAPDEMTFDALLQGGYSSLNSSFNNYKLVIGGSNRFFGKRLGVFAQVDLERRDRSSNEVAVNYVNRTSRLDSFPISLGAMSVRDVRRDIQRAGATVVLDYRLKSGTLKMSNFLSLINNRQEDRYELYNPFYSTHSYGMKLTGNEVRVMTNALKYSNTFGAFGLDVGVSYSQSINELPRNIDFFATEPNAFEPQAATTNVPDSIQYYARNNIGAANVQRISKTLYDTHEEAYGAHLDLSRDFLLSGNINLQINVGVKYKKTDKAFLQESFTIPVAQAGHGRPFVTAAIEAFPWLNSTLAPDASKLPHDLFVDQGYGKNSFPEGNYYIQNVPDIEKINDFADLAEDFYFMDHILSTKDNYTGSEEYKAAYIMPVVKIGGKITFIPGVRYEHNATSYTAVRGNNTFQDWDAGYFHHDTTVTRTNGFLLPMIHLKYKPLEWFDVRLAYTHTLARPGFNQIIPSWDIGINSIQFNNPFLTPSLSRNFDIYLSAYKNKLGLFTIGGFYKEIDGLIYNAGNRAVTAADIEEHSLPADSEGTAISKVVNNANPAILYGLEIEWQTRFWYLDNFLKGLLLTANYTKTFSNVDYERTVLNQIFLEEPPWVDVEEESTPYSERLIFQPSDIFNLTLGYDYKELSTRLSFVYQNNIFSNPNFFRLLRGATDDYFRIDFSVNQKLPWDGFEAILNFSNLTSTKEQDLLISNNHPTRVQYYGFTLDLGLRYRIQ
ncbi:MAG: TonB-dependent receptor [Bacteroidota bacterium]